jgi:hypothetical protein
MAIVCLTDTARVKMVVASFMQPEMVHLLAAISSWRPNHVMARRIALPDFEISTDIKLGHGLNDRLGLDISGL